METELLKTVGQIAGIGGIALLGFFLYRDIRRWRMCKDSGSKTDCAIAQQKDPAHMYVDLPEGKVNAEIALLEKYQAFSAEIVRLSLLAVAFIGFIYKEVLKDVSSSEVTVGVCCGPIATGVATHKYGVILVSIILFSLATVSALVYRYQSTEALRYYVEGLRYKQRKAEAKTHPEESSEDAKKCLAKRDGKLRYTFGCKRAAVVMFAGGALTLAVFVGLLFCKGTAG